MIGYLENMVHHQDEPLADWVCIPLYFVSKLAHDNGVTVVQVGEGSDEQFCGYDGYMRYLKLYHKFWTPFRSLPQPVQTRRRARRLLGLEAASEAAGLRRHHRSRRAQPRTFLDPVDVDLEHQQGPPGALRGARSDQPPCADDRSRRAGSELSGPGQL